MVPNSLNSSIYAITSRGFYHFQCTYRFVYRGSGILCGVLRLSRGLCVLLLEVLEGYVTPRAELVKPHLPELLFVAFSEVYLDETLDELVEAPCADVDFYEFLGRCVSLIDSVPEFELT